MVAKAIVSYGVTKSENLRAKQPRIAKKRPARTGSANKRSQSARVKLNAAHAPSSSSSDEETVSEQLTSHTADQAIDLQDSFSSPDTALHGIVDANFEEYVLRLTSAAACRCIKVAENTRGLLCLAIATGRPGPQGVIVQVAAEHPASFSPLQHHPTSTVRWYTGESFGACAVCANEVQG